MQIWNLKKQKLVDSTSTKAAAAVTAADSVMHSVDSGQIEQIILSRSDDNDSNDPTGVKGLCRMFIGKKTIYML